MYIYKITNLINKKIYIGKSQLDISENPEYYGSGKIIKRAIKKYGKENFTKDIICETFNIDNLNKLEKSYIYIFKSIFGEMCYNIAEGGQGGNSLRYYTEEQMKEFRNKMSEITSGENNPFFNKTHSDKTKKLCGIQNIGNKNKLGYKMSEESKKKLSELKTGTKFSKEVNKKKSCPGEKNGMYGKSHSKETIEKISQNIKESKKEKIECPYCGKFSDKGNYNRWHGENCKMNPNISQEDLDKRIPWNKKGSTTRS